MSKKILSISLTLIIALSVFTATATAATTPSATTKPAASGLTATPTNSKVLINGKDTSFDAYLIEGNNYFKLRDLAYVLSGTEKQFEVGWDGDNNAISLTSGMAYTVVGGEMTGKGAGCKSASSTSSKIFLDDIEINFTAFNIEDNNYFKLRDVGEAFDFGVDWDGAKNTIVIDTGKGYSLDGTTSDKPPEPTPKPAQTPEPTPAPSLTPTPTPSQSPIGSVNPDLIGPWRGMIGPYMEVYVELRADGSFGMQRASFDGPAVGVYRKKLSTVIVGRWSFSNGSILFSQQKMAQWKGYWYNPIEDEQFMKEEITLTWESINDNSWRISDIHEPDDHTIERHLLLLDIPGTQIYTDFEKDAILIMQQGGVVLNNEPLPPQVYIGD